MTAAPDIRNHYPHLKSRALGWLRHLHRKATTEDDWSEDGEPLEWWDRYSTEPMLNFPRFDLSESSYALGLMADQTPAWCELYGRILEGLAERHLTYWAAIDWLTQFGPDPRRKDYPQEWIDLFIPPHLIGEYDTPGWVANGVAPWGLQPDPIGADGNLFFKGWLNLVQTLHAYVVGEDKWGQPFEVAGVERARFEWTQHRLVEHLVQQWTDNPLGPHCENTKIWPYCLSAAGLGLQLYDGVFGKQTHQVYGSWDDHTRGKYFGLDKGGNLQWGPLYYDPQIDHLQTTGPQIGLALSFYMMPQEPVFAEFLYRSAVRFLQWDQPAVPVFALPDPRLFALGLSLAGQYGDYVTEARLREYAEQHFEPRHFGDHGDEFGFWFGLGERWPRGQLSALAILAEIGEKGAWQSLFRTPNLEKFNAPTVEGIDYPAFGVAQAWNDTGAGMLQLVVYAGDPGKGGESTKFRVARLPAPESVKVLCDNAEHTDWRVVGPDTIEVTTTIRQHSFQFLTGYRGGPGKVVAMQGTGQSAGQGTGARSGEPGGTMAGRAARAAARTERKSRPAVSARAVLRPPWYSAGCPCCVPGTP